jgi:hypothetical protein
MYLNFRLVQKYQKNHGFLSYQNCLTFHYFLCFHWYPRNRYYQRFR